MRMALGKGRPLQCGRAWQGAAIGAQAIGRWGDPEGAGSVFAGLVQGEGLVSQQVAGDMALQRHRQRRPQARIARIEHCTPAVALGELLQHGVGGYLGDDAGLGLSRLAQVDPRALHIALLGGCYSRGLGPRADARQRGNRRSRYGDR
ncbi:hypothetical protein D3C72_1503710 [compost metagenome]